MFKFIIYFFLFNNSVAFAQTKIVVVSSKNPIKINAVKKAFEIFIKDFEVIGIDTKSQVNIQPVNDELTTALQNRAKDAMKIKPNADFYVSIQNGILDDGKNIFDRSAVSIYDNKKGTNYTYISGELIKIDRKDFNEAKKIGFDKTTVANIMLKNGKISNKDDLYLEVIYKTRRDVIKEDLTGLLKENIFKKEYLDIIKNKKVVIVGSYRKFYKEVVKKIEEFEDEGINVLMPAKSTIINYGDEFIKFEGDQNIPIKLIEMNFLESVKKADFIYVVNPNGYVGVSAAFEMGFAYSIGKPIYCMEKPADVMMRMFCGII